MGGGRGLGIQSVRQRSPGPFLPPRELTERIQLVVLLVVPEGTPVEAPFLVLPSTRANEASEAAPAPSRSRRERARAAGVCVSAGAGVKRPSPRRVRSPPCSPATAHLGGGVGTAIIHRAGPETLRQRSWPSESHYGRKGPFQGGKGHLVQAVCRARNIHSEQHGPCAEARLCFPPVYDFS